MARARVLDVAGRVVRNLGEVWRPAGMHSIAWDGRDAAGTRVPPGTYFARVTTDGRELVRRLTVTR
jgi:flagellar hook assembly protein FlgD